LDSKSEEETVFVYLNPNKETGDPYQLEILNNFNDRDKNRYYTLSGKGLTLYIKDTPQEFISLGQWLIERDSYNCIKEFKFFKQFKKWKFMRMWKKTIKREARVKATNQLETKLFILQNIFSDHLMRHRKLMLEMANRKFIDECEGSGEVKTLEDFAQSQVNKTE
jgi:dynein heavy chain